MATKKTPEDKVAKARAALLKPAIANVAFDGFVQRAIDDAAKELGIATETAALAFPKGPRDLLRAWSEGLDDEVRAELEKADLASLKVRERIAKGGGDWFAEYAVPTAILQLRQGFGRLIRGHADQGVVAILDPRLRTRGYGRRFLEALPPAPLVADLGAVADFLGARERATA